MRGVDEKRVTDRLRRFFMDYHRARERRGEREDSGNIIENEVINYDYTLDVRCEPTRGADVRARPSPGAASASYLATVNFSWVLVPRWA
jgi:hypothetical protein